MARERLSDTEIRRRLQEGRNYKRLYTELKVKYDALAAENKQLKAELADVTARFEAIVTAQAARIEQLEAMVFGRRSKGGQTATPSSIPSRPRPDSSYRRAIPSDAEVTRETYQAIDSCGRCGGPLAEKQKYVRFVEDIVLAALSELPLRTVEKQTIERGWCAKCGHFAAAADLRGQPVSLGPQVRLLVAYLSNILGLTYGQIQTLLGDQYGFSMTDGEVAAILDGQRRQLLSAYEALKARIREGPGHFDETRYRIQSAGGGYAWVMASAATDEVAFRCGESRGKSNAESLAGADFTAVGVSDRYGAYKHLFAAGKHQICWAHLGRTARDLSRLECLDGTGRKQVTDFYHRLSAVYALVRKYHAGPFDEAVRQRQAARLQRRVLQLCRPNQRDPKDLIRLKAGIREYQDCLFVCLLLPGVPPDNNKAERHLRKLVLKRRRSFGVKTKKGAQVLETLMSVCWSLWYRDRSHFFQNLQQAMQQQAA